jgi:hypothetical protein
LLGGLSIVPKLLVAASGSLAVQEDADLSIALLHPLPAAASAKLVDNGAKQLAGAAPEDAER